MATATIREKLSQLLNEAMPDLIFEPADLKRGQPCVTDGPHWSIYAKKQVGLLKYDLIQFVGEDSMTQCVKDGLYIRKERFFYSVWPKPSHEVLAAQNKEKERMRRHIKKLQKRNEKESKNEDWHF